MSKEEKEDAIVKIDSGIYEMVRSRVLDNSVENPSIKNFIERAVVNFLGATGSYDVEGVSYTKTKNKPLKELAISNKNFAPCLLCEKMFLKNKSDKSEVARVCPKCKQIIGYFKEKI